jgi:hypothetical protein
MIAMQLSEMKKQVRDLNILANRTFKGKTFLIKRSLLDECESDEMLKCKVDSVDLQENAVELIYEMDGIDDFWTIMKIEDFEKYATAQ